MRGATIAEMQPGLVTHSDSRRGEKIQRAFKSASRNKILLTVCVRNIFFIVSSTEKTAMTFYLDESHPTGDRLTRFRTVQTSFHTESEAVSAFRASLVKSAIVREIDDEKYGIGRCRVVCKRNGR
jgi:hypothetical protein